MRHHKAVGFLWFKDSIKPVTLHKSQQIKKFIDGNGKHKAVSTVKYFYTTEVNNAN